MPTHRILLTTLLTSTALAQDQWWTGERNGWCQWNSQDFWTSQHPDFGAWLCHYKAEANRVYSCVPPEQFCTTWGVTAVLDNRTLESKPDEVPGQILCENPDGDAWWYCKEGFEICDPAGTAFCQTTFESPLKGLSDVKAVDVVASVVADGFVSPTVLTVVTATPASTGTGSPQVTGDTTGSVQTTGDAAASQISNLKESKGVSGGGIAGAVIGGVALLALLSVGAFFLWRRSVQRAVSRHTGYNGLVDYRKGENASELTGYATHEMGQSEHYKPRQYQSITPVEQTSPAELHADRSRP